MSSSESWFKPDKFKDEDPASWSSNNAASSIKNLSFSSASSSSEGSFPCKWWFPDKELLAIEFNKYTPVKMIINPHIKEATLTGLSVLKPWNKMAEAIIVAVVKQTK